MSELKVLLCDENKGFGGAERHLLTLAAGLQKRRALSFVAARKTSWLANNMGSLPYHPVGYRNEVDMLSVYNLYRKIKAEQINVVHCIGHRDLVAAALALNLPGAPNSVLVKAEHSYPDPKLSSLFRWAYGRCQAITSVSESLQKAVQEAVTPGPQVTLRVVPNGFDPGPAPEPAAPADSRPLHLGVLSPLRPGKGHSDFLKACAGLRQARPEQKLRLSIAGDGELSEALQSEAESLELDLQFLGHVEQPMEYLASLDLSVVPSHRETFSLVTLESLASGRPVLAANCDGIQELCRDYKSTQLYPVGDIEALQKAMAEFCDEASPRAELALSESALVRERFSLEAMTEQYCQLYSELSS